MALHDVIESSSTPIEVICAGKIMSMGVIVALGAKVRKAYRNTTFMIHQVKGLSIGSLREMEDTVAEASRINEMLFTIIKTKTKVTEVQLNEVLQCKKDWFITAEEALGLGIITEITGMTSWDISLTGKRDRPIPTRRPCLTGDEPAICGG